MMHADGSPRAPLGVALSRLRNVLLAQAETLSADDFDGLERLTVQREELVAALGDYSPADIDPALRPLIDQIRALDQRLVAVVRDSLERTGQELRDIHRGRGALNEYRRRGQSLTTNRAQLDHDR
jgi:hypothetical protein